MYALYPNETEKYVSDVENARNSKTNLQDKQWNMDIKDDFIDELLKYDYVSKKKGRGLSSILMNKVGKGRNNKSSKMRSRQNQDDQINSMGDYE